MPTVRKLLSLILMHKSQMFLGVLCMILYAIFTVAPAKFMKDIVDALGSGKVPDQSQFVLVAFGIVLLFFFKGVFFYGQSFLMNSLGQRITWILRDRMFDRLVALPIAFHNKAQKGDLLSRFTSDLLVVSNAVKTAVQGPLRDMPQILMLLGLMLYRSWQLFLLIILLLPLVAYLINHFGRQSKLVGRQRQDTSGEMASLLMESISGIRIVKAFQMERYEQDRFEKENEKLHQQFMVSAKIGAYSFPILEFIGGVCGALILTYGGYLMVEGNMTGGDFASFITAFFMLNEPIKKLNGFSIKLQEGVAAANRVYELLENDYRIEEVSNPITLPPLQDKITIRIQQFDYDGKPALGKLELELKAGTATALVGASGSGKSTLANLLPRFYDLKPEQGQILFDGQDIRQASLKSLRGQIAMVTQEVVLFHDTVASNIGYGDSNCDQEALHKAAEAAFALDFIDKLPLKFEEVVGEGGARLSGGQRQRLAIARALLKNAPILILDEATSALDTESEQEVQAAIENLMKNRTSLVIAHRLSTIQNADVIHVLKAGQIIESGTHAELIARQGEYKRLYDAQFQNPS